MAEERAEKILKLAKETRQLVIDMEAQGADDDAIMKVVVDNVARGWDILTGKT